MKRLLLTGIGGSIGCHVLAHIMHNTDWCVVGIDSFRHKGLTDRVAEVMNSHAGWWGRLTIHTHDLRAPFSKLMETTLMGADYIVNMASLSDVDLSLFDPVTTIKNNVDITLTMLELARVLQPQAFIQISTDEVYGPSGEASTHREWSPILPSNPYAASKAAQEALAIAYWRSYSIPLIITNTMNNFGEMQQPGKFPAMVQSKVAKGEMVTIHGKPGNIGSRFYLHSRNFADALLFILRNVQPYQHRPGEIDRPDRFNIVGDKRVDNLEMAMLIAKFMGKDLEYEFVDFHATRPGHDRHYGLDGGKLWERGWSSPISFEESLRRTIEWTAAHPEWLEQ